MQENEFSFADCFENPPSSSLGMEDLLYSPMGGSRPVPRTSRGYSLRAIWRLKANSLPQSCLLAAQRESLGEPKSIAFDEEDGLCYVLGYSRKLTFFRKPVHHRAMRRSRPGAFPASLTEPAPCLSEKSQWLRFLVAGGGAGLGVIALDLSGQRSLSPLSTQRRMTIPAIRSIGNLASLEVRLSPQEDRADWPPCSTYCKNAMMSDAMAVDRTAATASGHYPDNRVWDSGPP